MAFTGPTVTTGTGTTGGAGPAGTGTGAGAAGSQIDSTDGLLGELDTQLDSDAQAPQDAD